MNGHVTWEQMRDRIAEGIGADYQQCIPSELAERVLEVIYPGIEFPWKTEGDQK